VALVIVAAGRGTRFRASENKLLAPLSGLPVVCHCLRRFAAVIRPEMMVLVVPRGQGPAFAAALRQARIGRITMVTGGAARQDSVALGLAAVPPTARYVAVQDAARPFTSATLLRQCIRSARQHGSGVAARRVTDTIKVASAAGRVQSTPDRGTLWAAETPQVFRRDVLAAAYARVKQEHEQVTDDAQAVERLGHTVVLVEHTEDNRKITYAADFETVAARPMPTTAPHRRRPARG
jgi:2-C-methyl-D-erythritol 4-phosphate cytidylyltransferase